jgi:hypothetical protein
MTKRQRARNRAAAAARARKAIQTPLRKENMMRLRDLVHIEIANNTSEPSKLKKLPIQQTQDEAATAADEAATAADEAATAADTHISTAPDEHLCGHPSAAPGEHLSGHPSASIIDTHNATVDVHISTNFPDEHPRGHPTFVPFSVSIFQCQFLGQIFMRKLVHACAVGIES